MTIKDETQGTEDEVVEPTEAENDAALLEAISAGIDEGTPQDVLDAQQENDDNDDSPDAGPTDDTSTDESGTDDAAGNKEDEAGGKPADAEGDGESTEAEGEGSGDGAKEGDDKSGDDATQSDAATGEVDPINDPIPEATNEKTAERIQSLIGIAKDNQGAAEDRDEIVDRITDTGSTPEQYANTLGFLKLYNSAEEDDRRKALAAAQGLVRELSIDLGEGTQDMLANHQDLQDEVEAGTLDQKRAIELATGREKTALDASRTTAANQTASDADMTATNIETGKQQLDAVGVELAADPAYEKLAPQFKAILRNAARRTHPTEWGAAAREIFAELKAVAPVAVAPASAPAPTNTPLRATQGAGGGSDKEGEPEDALAAMNNALGEM